MKVQGALSETEAAECTKILKSVGKSGLLFLGQAGCQGGRESGEGGGREGGNVFAGENVLDVLAAACVSLRLPCPVRRKMWPGVNVPPAQV